MKQEIKDNSSSKELDNSGYSIGETVICGGEKDTIISFITPDDEENYTMGYRVNLKNNGTQSFAMIQKANPYLNQQK